MDVEVVTKHAESVAWNCLDDEVILLNLRNGFYYTLNEVGCDAWQLIDEKRTIREIGREVRKMYDVDLPQIEQDLCLLFQQMYQEGLIVIADKSQNYAATGRD